MNIVPIILLSILIILLIVWCIQERNTSNLHLHLDCFLIVNNYIKRSFYKVLQEYHQSESVKLLRHKIDHIDQFLTPWSQQFTKGLLGFPRKDELIHELRQELGSHSKSVKDLNLFLFPDTLVQKSNPNYYKNIICRVTEMLGQRCHVKTNQEAKLILESI